ncbi:hypothetical protein BDK51DRAFT_30771 [Blyttiomyces helicus]|uniref:Galactose oxidase n=1 Tax=Blyttiomyces helicus TaxID=388810 RepID=A0A4P9WKZ6_9FUNG|nr:hypothetical protein BDK51DRAFT_30771 [Blyttiomyces helicus]|eukprot:RKO93689.1 hypothetical protein BDK51DRAFT_30771 [Blyttiomyces helicus]
MLMAPDCYRLVRLAAVAIALAALSASSSAQTIIPERSQAVLAAGASDLYFIGGFMHDSNAAPPPRLKGFTRSYLISLSGSSSHLATIDRELALIRSSIVQVSLTSQSASNVPVPTTNSSTRQLAAMARACAQTPDTLYCHGSTSAINFTPLPSELDSFIFATSTFGSSPPSLDTIPQLADHSMTIVGDYGYIFGGRRGSKRILELDLNGPPNPTVISAPGSPSPRTSHCGTNFGKDSIVIYGGYGDRNALSDMLIFNTTTGAWRTVPEFESQPGTIRVAACTSVDGVPYLFGNETLWSYSAADIKWNKEDALGGPSALADASMTSVNSRWLVVSGGGLLTPWPVGDSSFYYYDLITSRWFVNSVGTSLLSTTSTTTGSPSPIASSPSKTASTLGYTNISATAASPSSTASVVGSAKSSGSSPSAGDIAGAAGSGLVVLILMALLDHPKRARAPGLSAQRESIAPATLSDGWRGPPDDRYLKLKGTEEGWAGGWSVECGRSKETQAWKSHEWGFPLRAMRPNPEAGFLSLPVETSVSFTPPTPRTPTSPLRPLTPFDPPHPFWLLVAPLPLPLVLPKREPFLRRNIIGKSTEAWASGESEQEGLEEGVENVVEGKHAAGNVTKWGYPPVPPPPLPKFPFPTLLLLVDGTIFLCFFDFRYMRPLDDRWRMGFAAEGKSGGGGRADTGEQEPHWVGKGLLVRRVVAKCSRKPVPRPQSRQDCKVVDRRRHDPSIDYCLSAACEKSLRNYAIGSQVPGERGTTTSHFSARSLGLADVSGIIGKLLKLGWIHKEERNGKIAHLGGNRIIL